MARKRGDVGDEGGQGGRVEQCGKRRKGNEENGGGANGP